jgi:hypothetical protein
LVLPDCIEHGARACRFAPSVLRISKGELAARGNVGLCPTQCPASVFQPGISSSLAEYIDTFALLNRLDARLVLGD